MLTDDFYRALEDRFRGSRATIKHVSASTCLSLKRSMPGLARRCWM